MRRFIRGVSAAAAAGVVLALAGPAGPAQAASLGCKVGPYPLFPSSCTTGYMPANPNGHWLDLHVEASDPCPLKYKVWDRNAGVVVYEGTVNYPYHPTIGGLHSDYWLELKRVTHCGGKGRIDNELP
jgi:hypothetical protein